MKRLTSTALLLVLAALARTAWGGGYEYPDNGTEQLARGGAFTAKADDATAVEYNVAGLAQQRGTNMLIDVNLTFLTQEFQRAGSYPVDARPEAAAFSGKPFPLVSNQGGVFAGPFFGVSTDFGRLKRWTFAFAVYGPPSYGSRNYGDTVNGLPAPSRYDVTKLDVLIVYPSLAVGFRATRWLDLGLALQLVVGHFNLNSVSFTDLGSNICMYAEDPRCDARTNIDTSGVTATVAVGALFHPLPSLAIGLHLRPPVDIDASGTVHSAAPAGMPVMTLPGDAEFHTHLPLELRLGLRYIFLKDGFEAGDIELDGVYQSWGLVEDQGDRLVIPSLSFRGTDGEAVELFHDIRPTVTHHYQDTVSVRLGGAWNARLPMGVLTLRAGGYFDSAATHYADTRLDLDTAAKWAVTAGLGYRVRGIGINVAYAFVWEPDRDVSNGDVRPINPVTNGSSVGASGALLPAVNNGHYHTQMHILSVGMTIRWDELVRRRRATVY
jgi:long-chain fatty acid transport protein